MIVYYVDRYLGMQCAGYSGREKSVVMASLSPNSSSLEIWSEWTFVNN